MHSHIWKRTIVLFLPLAVLGAHAALAQPVIQPGESRTFTTVDGGDRDCRRGSEDGLTEFLDCFLVLRFLGTKADPDADPARVDARVSLLPLNANGIPSYATAFLFKDITVGGPPDSMVPVQISMNYNYRNFFVMAAAYFVQSSVSIRVVDLLNGKDVTTHTLFETSRDGDQGFTDVAAASERQIVEGANASFTAFLRRGRSYRLVLELEVMAQTLAAGALVADARLDWLEMTVRIDEDEVEQLAQHDEDIKALLMQVIARQEETIRLLLTPQGQRESDLGSWPLKAGDNPVQLRGTRGLERGRGRQR